MVSIVYGGHGGTGIADNNSQDQKEFQCISANRGQFSGRFGDVANATNGVVVIRADAHG
jgi:hypothetical protein